MKKEKTEEVKASIVREAEFVTGYVRGFEIYSGKDEKALEEIQALMVSVHEAIARIETAHQRRIELMREMAKTVSEMENDYKKFSEKVAKKTT